jgi:hypothetical protein
MMGRPSPCCWVRINSSASWRVWARANALAGNALWTGPRRPQQCLCFFPLSHGQGEFLPIFMGLTPIDLTGEIGEDEDQGLAP